MASKTGFFLLTVVARNIAELQTVLASLATRGGQRLVTYLRLAEVDPDPAAAGSARARVRPPRTPPPK